MLAIIDRMRGNLGDVNVHCSILFISLVKFQGADMVPTSALCPKICGPRRSPEFSEICITCSACLATGHARN